MFLSSYTNTSGSLGEWVMLWEHELQASVSTAFSSSPYNSIETRSTCFLFLLENNATRKRKTTSWLWLSKCKFSLLTSSLRQQRALVLCLHQVIQTRFLTNQHACFLRTVFQIPFSQKRYPFYIPFIEKKNPFRIPTFGSLVIIFM